MNWKNPVTLLIIAILLTTSCAKRSTKKKPVEEPVAQSETSDTSLEFLDSFEEDDLFSMQSNDLQYEDSAVEIQAETAAAAPILGSGSSTYTVQQGDTLMYVAYKVYGDYRLWPSLANRNNLVGQASLRAGDVLSLDPSRVKTMPRKAGSVYLIKVGDSLSKISMANYGTFKQWEPLWKHNSEMIVDPNIIFAGFQMHLLPDNQLALNQ